MGPAGADGKGRPAGLPSFSARLGNDEEMSFSYSWDNHGLHSEEKLACSGFILLMVLTEGKGGLGTNLVQINWVSPGDLSKEFRQLHL